MIASPNTERLNLMWAVYTAKQLRNLAVDIARNREFVNDALASLPLSTNEQPYMGFLRTRLEMYRWALARFELLVATQRQRVDRTDEEVRTDIIEASTQLRQLTDWYAKARRWKEIEARPDTHSVARSYAWLARNRLEEHHVLSVGHLLGELKLLVRHLNALVPLPSTGIRPVIKAVDIKSMCADMLARFVKSDFSSAVYVLGVYRKVGRSHAITAALLPQRDSYWNVHLIDGWDSVFGIVNISVLKRMPAPEIADVIKFHEHQVSEEGVRSSSPETVEAFSAPCGLLASYWAFEIARGIPPEKLSYPSPERLNLLRMIAKAESLDSPSLHLDLLFG